MRENAESRKAANRMIAFAMEEMGMRWCGLTDAVLLMAQFCKVQDAWRRRSIVAAECAEKLAAKGFSVPADYVPPWEIPNSGGFRKRKERWSPQGRSP